MENHYLLAVVPPEEVTSFVDQYRERYAKYTSYSIPPHITVYPPFYLKDVSWDGLVALLEKEFQGAKPGNINLGSVGYFENGNNVAFLNPDEKSQEYLKGFLSKIVNVVGRHIRNVYDDYKISPEAYHAHITIAERIPDKVLPKIKKELNELKVDLQFSVTSIQLFAQSNSSKVWESLACIPLGA